VTLKIITLSLMPALSSAGRIGWHSFRHSLATNLRAAGVDLKTAQELLRRANSRITLEVYTRAISSTKQEANDRVMQMMLEAGQKKISAPSHLDGGFGDRRSHSRSESGNAAGRGILMFSTLASTLFRDCHFGLVP